MRYEPPVGSTDPNAPYVPRNLSAGSSTGSRVPTKAIEVPQREIVEAIAAFAGTPSAADLRQLMQGIGRAGRGPLAFARVLPTKELRFQPGFVPDSGTFGRASAASYVDPMGTLRQAVAGAPRFTADPATGVNLGMLFEEARTNSLLQSDLPATQTVSLPAGTYTLWVAGSGSATLSGGPAGTATAATPITFTLGATTSVTVTVAGTLARFQLENGATTTSYIATTSAAVTRAAETLTIPADSSWFNAVEGTVYIEGVIPPAEPSKPRYLFKIDDAPNNNRILAYRSSTSNWLASIIYIGGVEVSAVWTAPIAAGSTFRFAVSYSRTTLQVSLNGANSISAPYASTLPALTNLRIGSTDASGSNFNAPIARLVYWPRAIPAETLQRMTA